MSYSFNARAATKEDLKSEIARRLQEVVTAQPAHANDAEFTQLAACAAVDKLQDKPDYDVSASLNGSISWNDEGVQQIGFAVNVSFAVRPDAEPKAEGE